MQNFVSLFTQLDTTTKTNEKVAAIKQYFDKETNDLNKLWTVALFTHRRPPRAVKTSLLRTWCAEAANVPLWLFEDTYHIVGDLAETLAVMYPMRNASYDKPLHETITDIIKLKKEDEENQRISLYSYWDGMDVDQRFLFNKIITGGFRIGVSQKLMTKAIAAHLQKEEDEVAHRLMGDWTPHSTNWESLFLSKDTTHTLSKPYPFYLSYALEEEPETLGELKDWAMEYKWDGIRGQLIRRGGETYLWSRGEELVTDKFPEMEALKSYSGSDFVIDGEIMVWHNDRPGDFSLLQTRLGRKSVSKKLMKDAPVIIMAYDLLEYNGKDLRTRSYQERRALLYNLVDELAPASIIHISPVLNVDNWEHAKQLRINAPSLVGAEGLMLKKVDSTYEIGRKRGSWWKWKVDPYTVDAVMIYAQRGHGRRANLFSDFTFAVWHEGQLLPFAKAYSGLTDKEFAQVSHFVKSNTIERFGPVHSVVASQVFEIAFEGISLSPRHKSGVALRFPRIKQWRLDKKAEEADTLASLKALL